MLYKTFTMDYCLSTYSSCAWVSTTIILKFRTHRIMKSSKNRAVMDASVVPFILSSATSLAFPLPSDDMPATPTLPQTAVCLSF